jgi:hypothetical protein
VTCTRNVHRRHRELNKALAVPDGLFSGYEISHYYYQIGFQPRDSLHVHKFVWLKDAPAFETGMDSTIDGVCDFIDSVNSCWGSQGDKKLRELLSLRTHKHMRTRKKGAQGHCPYFPSFQRGNTNFRPIT